VFPVYVGCRAAVNAGLPHGILLSFLHAFENSIDWLGPESGSLLHDYAAASALAIALEGSVRKFEVRARPRWRPAIRRFRRKTVAPNRGTNVVGVIDIESVSTWPKPIVELLTDSLEILRNYERAGTNRPRLFRALVRRRRKGAEMEAKRTGWTAGGEKLSDIREGSPNHRFSGAL
jgi:hypothetical protein